VWREREREREREEEPASRDQRGPKGRRYETEGQEEGQRPERGMGRKPTHSRG
jgi:hypothetical protein